MALSSETVWEVRPSAGSDTNGGGFDSSVASPGTDFSQQNSAQQAYTDLVATSTTTATSVARAFSSVDVGNFLRVVSGAGWTTGIYRILSVSAGTATFDRAIATNGSTGGTANLGGALATIQSGIPSYSSADQLSGHVIYIKGTLTQTAVMTLNSHVEIVGYTSSRADRGRATITTATNSTTLINTGAVYNHVFRNLILSNTAATRGVGYSFASSSPANLAFINCVFDGFTYALDGGQDFVFAANIDKCLLKNCEIKNCTIHAMRLYSIRSCLILGCYIHDNTGDGVSFQFANGGPGTLSVTDCVIKSNSGKGISDNAGSNTGIGLIVRNSAILNNTSDGISISGAGQSNLIENCILDSNGGYGINLAVGGLTGTRKTMIFGGNNAYRSNTSGARNNWPAQSGDVTLTGDPFTNRSGGDFSLNTTAGAGAACAGAGGGLGF